MIRMPPCVTSSANLNAMIAEPVDLAAPLIVPACPSFAPPEEPRMPLKQQASDQA
jgi:hypothetical protein